MMTKFMVQNTRRHSLYFSAEDHRQRGIVWNFIGRKEDLVPHAFFNRKFLHIHFCIFAKAMR